MWQSLILTNNAERFTFRLKSSDSLISHRQFLNMLANDREFVSWYNQLLVKSEFDAFFWENKPVTENNLDETYECTLIKSQSLSRVSADSQTFDSYFSETSDVVSFPNLGGDAQLIVPCPEEKKNVYTQIGSFIRDAPKQQIINFWSRTGSEMQSAISEKPRWLSTSGLGVYWLHVRIDSVPKYYQTEAYKTL